MEREEIQRLLEKYYEGTTTEEEEALLKASLQHEGSRQLTHAGEALLLFPDNGTEEPSMEFMQRLEAITHDEKKHPRSLRLISLSLSSAAAIAILVASYLIMTETRSDRMKDTYTDPAIAMAEVKNILFHVSETMNTGTKPLNNVSTLNKAPELLNSFSIFSKTTGKSLEKLQHLNMLDKEQSATEEIIKK